MSLVLAIRNPSSITLYSDSGAISSTYHVYPCGEKKIEQIYKHLAIGVVGDCLLSNKALIEFDWLPKATLKKVKTPDDYFKYLIRDRVPLFLDTYSSFLDEDNILPIEVILVFKDTIFHVMDDGATRIVPTPWAAIGREAEALAILHYCQVNNHPIDIPTIFQAVASVNASCIPHRIDSITISF